MKRAGASVGDDVYVTGTLGDAAAGLVLCQQGEGGLSNLTDDELSYQADLIERLNKPVPRIEVGMALRKIATACIDVSDGLAGDLGHILESSSVGAELYAEAIPCSDALHKFAKTNQHNTELDLALYGGDDYELCFTTSKDQHTVIQKISEQTTCKITRIGKIIADKGLYIVEDAHTTEINQMGFEHFSKS